MATLETRRHSAAQTTQAMGLLTLPSLSQRMIGWSVVRNVAGKPQMSAISSTSRLVKPNIICIYTYIYIYMYSLLLLYNYFFVQIIVIQKPQNAVWG